MNPEIEKQSELKATSKTAKSIIVFAASYAGTFLIMLVGAASALGVFAVIRGVDQRKERNDLIPRAKEATLRQEYSKAINYYEKAEKVFPKDTEIKKNLASLYASKGRYEDAIKYYNSIDQSQMTDSNYEKLGEIYYELKDYGNAIKSWQSKSISSKNSYKLARSYYNTDQIDKYIETLKSIDRYKEPLIHLQVNEDNLSNVLSNINKAEKLESISDEKINMDLLKSQLTDAKNQSDKGKKEFSDLIQIAAFTNINECKLLFSKIDELKKTFESKKIPVYQVDYYKGVCLNQINKPDEAIPLIESAIKADSTLIEYREALAKSYFLKKDNEKLKQIYNDILKLQKSALHYENLAIFQYKLGLFDESIANYDLSLKEYGDNKDARIRISKTILHIGLVDKKNTEVCNRSELISNLDMNDKESLLIAGICRIAKNENVNDLKGDTLITEYINSLKNKDNKKIESILDKDLDGLLTTYHNAIGENILNAK